MCTDRICLPLIGLKGRDLCGSAIAATQPYGVAGCVSDSFLVLPQ